MKKVKPKPLKKLKCFEAQTMNEPALKPLPGFKNDRRENANKKLTDIPRLKDVENRNSINSKISNFTLSNVTGDKARKNESNEIDYHVIGSGSTGNSVRIENLIFDIGLAYKHIKEDLYKTDAILITHIHSDHIKESTYKRIREEFPNIKIIGNHEVATIYDLDFICNEKVPFEVAGVEITPFRAKHDVLCYGYTFNIKNNSIIYCTDSSDFNNSPKDGKYDYLFLESNHDKNKLNAINRSQQYKKYGYNVYESGLRHCSTQACMGFYYLHRRNKNSKLIELHKSNRFY